MAEFVGQDEGGAEKCRESRTLRRRTMPVVSLIGVIECFDFDHECESRNEPWDLNGGNALAASANNDSGVKDVPDAAGPRWPIQHILGTED